MKLVANKSILIANSQPSDRNYNNTDVVLELPNLSLPNFGSIVKVYSYGGASKPTNAQLKIISSLRFSGYFILQNFTQWYGGYESSGNSTVEKGEILAEYFVSSTDDPSDNN